MISKGAKVVRDRADIVAVKVGGRFAVPRADVGRDRVDLLSRQVDPALIQLELDDVDTAVGTDLHLRRKIGDLRVGKRRP